MIGWTWVASSTWYSMAWAGDVHAENATGQGIFLANDIGWAVG